MDITSAALVVRGGALPQKKKNFQRVLDSAFFCDYDDGVMNKTNEEKLSDLHERIGNQSIQESEEQGLFDELVRLEDLINPPKNEPDCGEGEGFCHLCGIATELECTFDKEMNPFSEPASCCGCGSCAEDV